MSFVGLDIGGANLKLAYSPEFEREPIELPFPLWQQPDQLPRALHELFATLPAETRVAATMTGELADCFATKREGVRFIVEAVVTAASNRNVDFYRTDGSWATPSQATEEPLRVASANWHALATYAGRFLPDASGYLIDIGSTTTDIIPIAAGNPTHPGQTDVDRLSNQQLIYTGVGRSSIAGLIESVSYDGTARGIANEYFASIADAYLWLRQIPERNDSGHSADGRPMTRPNAGQRLARLLCSDADEIGDATIDAIADAAATANVQKIVEAIERIKQQNPTVPNQFLVSGSGAWLAEQILETQFVAAGQEITRLDQSIGQPASIAAAAHAVATLASEETAIQARSASE